jgi:hypothetical protein
MSVAWTINGQSFAALELANVARELRNMAIDRMTFDAPGRAVDAAPLLAYDQEVIILRDGRPFFRGRAGRGPVTGSSKAEEHSYEVLGPWEQLERLTFQQRWLTGSWIGDEWVPRWEYKSRVILGQDESGMAKSLGMVIAEVISYARECGVAIDAGVIEGAHYVPWDEGLDLMCSDVIRRMARWSPDSVGWIDYSTEVPTFNFRRRAGLPTASLAMSNLVKDISLTPIGARSVPAVVLKYEQTHEVEGATMESIATDVFPQGATGREIGAVVQTIQLEGGRVNTQIQRHDIKSVELPPMQHANALLLQWFLLKNPQYADPVNPAQFDPARYSEAQITAVQRVSDLPYELMEGAIQDWMRLKLPEFTRGGEIVMRDNPHHSYDYNDAEDTIQITLSYKVMDESGKPLRQVVGETVAITITATDCPTGKYTRRSTDVEGAESIPVGLAEMLWTSLNASHYQGKVSTVAEEITGSVNIGFRLVVTGGNAAWATMSAVIQQITNHLDTGTTTIQVGPPSHLSPGQVLDLRQANRSRRPASGSLIRTTGDSAGGGALEFGSAQPKNNGGHGPGQWGIRKDFIVDLRFDTVTNCLQVKKQTAVVDYAATEDLTGWLQVTGGCAEECSDGYP